MASTVKIDHVAHPRVIAKKIESVKQGEGEGAVVRRSIGRPELKNLDPFLMLDEFYVSRPAGFPDHPHRGQETVTYMLDGKFRHEDFAGHVGEIGPGDLQWMTAGRGIVHCEMPLGEGEGHGLQLWVNLAHKDKMVEPAYQELLAKDIPKVSANGVTVSVIAGSAFGTTSPVYTRTPTTYLHFRMAPGSVLTQALPAQWNGFVYTLKGEGQFGLPAVPPEAAAAEVSSDGTTSPANLSHLVGDGKLGTHTKAHHTLVLSAAREQDGMVVVAGSAGCDFVLIAGQPIGEPTVQYGPFVMNTQDEIAKTFEDYRSGKNGFERAPHWQSTEVASRE